jgi:hypothetical protein
LTGTRAQHRIIMRCAGPASVHAKIGRSNHNKKRLLRTNILSKIHASIPIHNEAGRPEICHRYGSEIKSEVKWSSSTPSLYSIPSAS